MNKKQWKKYSNRGKKLVVKNEIVEKDIYSGKYIYRDSEKNKQ